MGKINTSTIVPSILTILCLLALPAQAKYNGDGWQRLMYSSRDRRWY